MKRPRPFKTRIRNLFLAVAGAGTLSGTGVVTELMPKNPDTDTQLVFNRGTPQQYGVNISYIDQFWKQTLGLKSAESRAQDLKDAAFAGDSWRVAAVMEHGGVDLSEDGVLALGFATRENHRDVIDVLLKAGVPVNGQEDLAFRVALQFGHIDLAMDYMDMALPAKAHLENALISAAGYGSFELLDKTVMAGVAIDVRDNAALIAAAANGHASMIERLFVETITYKTFETVRVFLPPSVTDFCAGVNPDYMPEYGADYGRGYYDEWNGVMPDYPDYYKHNADVPRDQFGRAYIYSTIETLHVKTLVDPLAQDNLALRLAVMNGHVNAAKVLIDHGADINDPQIMINAARSGDVEMLKFIQAQTPMAVDAASGTPLYEAVKNGNYLMAQTLVELGANPNAGEGRIWKAAKEHEGSALMQGILKGKKFFGPDRGILPPGPSL